jgi:hypothetical protein
MKKVVHIAVQEEAMLKRVARVERRDRRREERKLQKHEKKLAVLHDIDDQLAELRPGIAAMVLARKRGWSASRIAEEHGWRVADVERYLAAWRALL